MVRRLFDSFVRQLRRNIYLSNLFLAVVYLVLGNLGLLFTYTNQNAVSIIWPAIGFAVFYLHFFGLKNIPGLLVGALLINYSSTGLVYFSVMAAVGTLITVYLAVRFAMPSSKSSLHIFSNFREMSRFLIGAFLLAPLASSSIGVLGLAMNGIVPNSDRYLFNVAKWWMGDSLGILFFVPFLICHVRSSEFTDLEYSKSKIEKYFLLLSLATLDFFIFCKENSQGRPVIPIYFQFPLMIMITARMGPKVLTQAMLMDSAIGLFGTVIGQGPFYRSLLTIDFQQIWLVLSMTTGTNLLLAAALYTDKQSRKAIQLQEQMLRTLANQSPVMLWLAHGIDKFSFFNERWLDFTGEKVEDLKGEAWLDLIHEDEKLKTKESFQRAFAEKSPFLIKYRLRRGNGSYSWVLNQGMPVVANSGAKSPYFIGSCTDVDEIESNKNKAIAESEQKTNFLGMVSHELRTPMNSVLGYVELLKRTPLTLKQKEHIRAIEISGRVLKNLLKDFLDISRIQSGKLSFEALPFSIEKMIEEVGTINREAYLLKKITLLTRVDTELKEKMVIGDSNRIRQVILNLVSNALKFSYKDSVLLLRASVREKTEDQVWVQFDIVDQGIGIETEAQKNIFEKYWQVNQDTSRTTDAGVGLGLSICKNLVEAMDGKIGVQSYPGFGTKIWFRLPLKFSEEAKDLVSLKVEEKEAQKEGTPTVKAPKALVVEDNFTNSTLMKEMLSQFGWDAYCVYTGQEALQNFATQQYQLILLDLNLPDMKGDQLAKDLKESHSTSFRIIGITGEDLAEGSSNGRFQYFDELLQKPLSMADLAKVLNPQLS